MKSGTSTVVTHEIWYQHGWPPAIVAILYNVNGEDEVVLLVVVIGGENVVPVAVFALLGEMRRRRKGRGMALARASARQGLGFRV